jgi:hypothetical protein
MKSVFVISLLALSTLAVAPAEAASWGPDAPGSYSPIRVAGPGSDFVVFTPTVTTTYAQEFINSFNGYYTDTLTVTCANGQTNDGSGNTFTGNTTVACPFFSSTISTASGTVTSF